MLTVHFLRTDDKEVYKAGRVLRLRAGDGLLGKVREKLGGGDTQGEEKPERQHP
jgi:hypothetical protein